MNRNSVGCNETPQNMSYMNFVQNITDLVKNFYFLQTSSTGAAASAGNREGHGSSATNAAASHQSLLEKIAELVHNLTPPSGTTSTGTSATNEEYSFNSGREGGCDVETDDYVRYMHNSLAELPEFRWLSHRDQQLFIEVVAFALKCIVKIYYQSV